MSRLLGHAERALRVVPPLHRIGMSVASPANRGRRWEAAWRTVRFDVRTRVLRRPTVVALGTRSRIIANPGESNPPHAAYRNPPNPREMYAWRRYLRPGDRFVDVGSNVGIYTIFALDLGAEVIACEPDPYNYGRLREHLALNGYEAETHNVALADQPGTVTLTQGLDSYNHLVLDGGTGLEVEARTLDDVVGDRYVAGVKIDVEGAERLVLEGASRLLAEQRIGLLQLEWAGVMADQTLGEGRDPIARLLGDAGYTFFRPDQEGVLRPLEPSYEALARDVFAAPVGTTFTDDQTGRS